MDRRSELLKLVTKSDLGIEIAPWFAPLTPKRDGYNCRILDVFSRSELMQRAASDANIDAARIAEIEDVDFIGSATEIETLVGAKIPPGSFDYVISSHNFEHLPDPIRFLQGCSKILKPGGLVILAVPDHRGCFDHFRPPTLLTDWIEAYFEKRQRPSPSQTFAQTAYHSRRVVDGVEHTGFGLADNPSEIVPYESLREAYDAWKRVIENPDDIYRDTHCTTFTPASFELLVTEANFLSLIDFEPVSISETNVFEFYVHLRNGAASMAPVEFYERRTQLLRRMKDEQAVASRWGWQRNNGGGDHSETLASLRSDIVARVDAMKTEIAASRETNDLRNSNFEAQVGALKTEIATMRETLNRRYPERIRHLFHQFRRWRSGVS